MKEKGHKILNVVGQIRKDEAARLALVKSAASVPDECGPDIAPAPARGGFVLQRIRHLDGMTRDDFVETDKGYVRRSPIRCVDAFDRAAFAAKRAKRMSPYLPSQIAVGRRYHDLVELLSADGLKLSQLQGSFGGSGKTDWMDQRMVHSDEVARLRRRIGQGTAMSVRRIRPSDRGEGSRGPILDRVLVDMFCLMGYGIKDVLTAHRWQSDSRNQKACREALCGALDRMIGYRD